MHQAIGCVGKPEQPILMNFKQRNDDEPDINLIPMIDVLLVVLIFLMVSTTYVKKTSLKVDLPQGSAGQTENTQERLITVRVSADGQYAIDSNPTALNEATLRTMLKSMTLNRDKSTDATRVSVEADGAASHQAVVTAMDAAAHAGISRVSIITAKQR